MFTYSKAFKPMVFSQFWDIYMAHFKTLWVPEEVRMAEDITDWNTKLSEKQKALLTNLFRFFVTGDMDVSSGYIDHLLPVVKAFEPRAMLIDFAARECFSDDTEVLTDSGFKLFSELEQNDSVAQYDVNTSLITFSKPLDYIKKQFDGYLDVYTGISIDLAVTPNHRMLVNKKGGELYFTESNQLICGEGRLQCTVAGSTDNPKRGITALQRLLIAMQADGWVQNRRVHIVVKKERKINRLKQLLKETGVSFSLLEKKGHFGVSIELPEEIEAKDVKTFGWLRNLPYTICALDFVKELVLWDGSAHVNSKKGIGCYYNTNEVAIDSVQLLCFLQGIRATKALTKSSHKPCWVLNIKNCDKGNYSKKQSISYSGQVYCVTMPKGTVVVRRNGKVSVQGQCIHVRAYAYLIDSLGMPDRLYKEFRQYKEMTAKHEFVFKSLLGFDEYETLIANLALFSGGAEGLQLFSSFAILFSFGKDHLLKEMQQIVRWSSRDEEIHVMGNMLLLNKTKELYPHAWNEKVIAHVYETVKAMVQLDDDFVDLCFSTGEAAYDLTPEQVKGFVRHLADTRFKSMGLKPLYNVDNPLPWVDEIINGINFANFFERGVTEYAVGSGTGSWSTPYDNNLFSKEAIIKHFKAGDVS